MTLTGYKSAVLTEKAMKLLKPFLGSLIKNHTGRRRAIKSKIIEETLGIRGETVRAMVSYLRAGDVGTARRPWPICSDSTGYWYAENPEEIGSTIAHLRERRNQMERVMAGLFISQMNLKNNLETTKQGELTL